MNGEHEKGKQVVLIADSSSTVRKFASFSLSAQNLEVITVVDGMDSTAPQVDLVIVDLNMPNMDGYEIIQHLRGSDHHKDVPIIILSYERSDESKKRGKEVGADVYIEKPFDANKIKYQASKYLALK